MRNSAQVKIKNQERIQQLKEKLDHIEKALATENKSYNRIMQELKNARKKESPIRVVFLEEEGEKSRLSVLRLGQYQDECKKQLRALYFNEPSVSDIAILDTLKTTAKEITKNSHVRIQASIGDLLYHKTYGKCIAFFRIGDTIKVCFGNDFVQAIPENTENQLFEVANRMVPKSYTYKPMILQLKFVQPLSDLQRKFQAFSDSQLLRLKDKLRLMSGSHTEATARQYANQAIGIVHQLQRAEKSFLMAPQKFVPEKYLSVEKLTQKEILIPQKTETVSAAESISKKTGNVQYDSDKNTLYVYNGRIKCIREKHPMTCVNAHIDTASDERAVLNVNYCSKCRRFYISYAEYMNYMEKYKALITRIVLVNENGNEADANYFAVESTLKLCGYTVSQERGFTAEDRARLLSNMIYNGIVSKSEVIQHINWLIHMNGKKAANFIAKEKWEEDLNFVRNLDTDNQPDYRIEKIEAYRTASSNNRK